MYTVGVVVGLEMVEPAVVGMSRTFDICEDKMSVEPESTVVVLVNRNKES